MDNKISTRINFSVEPVGNFEKINDIISKARVRIFYTGLNRNLTYITEEFANKLLQTLPYTPVGGLWSNEEEDFSDHGGAQPSNREKFRAFGVVPAEPNIQWENHLDNDGVLRRYACCDVYLWTARYQAAREIPKKAQSMELFLDSIKGDWKRDGAIEYFEFTDGCFFGLAALGKDVEPCFEGAAFYNFDESEKNFFEELRKYTLSTTDNKIGGTEMKLNTEEKINTPAVEDEATTTSEQDADTAEVTETSVEEAEGAENEEVENKQTEEETTETTETGEVDSTEIETETTETEETEETQETETDVETNEVDETNEDTTNNVEYELLVTENNNLKAQIEEYKAQVQELSSFKANIEKEQKTALLDKYSNLLDEETYQKYSANLEKYSYDVLKSEISVAIVENNENALFNKTTEEAVVVNIDNDKQLSGAARLMGKYFKN